MERQRATLCNVDAYLREREQRQTDGESEEDGGDGFIGVEAAIHVATVAEQANDDNFRYPSDWKRDVGERARRVYDWWRVIMNDNRGVPTFQEAVTVRLIATTTTQVSSAAVERVFSQLTFIRRAVGDLATQQVLETRAFVRCNNSMGDDFTA
jgi:hypothetical protein